MRPADHIHCRVIWFNLGNHHVPHTEDIPNTVTTNSASSVIFTPWNYHKDNPAKSSAAGVRIDLGTGASQDHGRVNTVHEFGDYGMSENLQGYERGSLIGSTND